jgi:cation diffusion facilitator family transporter
MTADDKDRDRWLLLLSVWMSAGFAVVSSVWGLLSGSAMIVLDGLYSFASIGLSLLAVLALRVARSGPSESYPWGREGWEPLTVVVKALALGGLCAYAIVEGIQDLLSGGREVQTVWALLYAVLATGAGVVVTVVLRRGARSDLVRAEAAEWQGDTLLSLAVLAGFALAAALVATGRADLAAYVDPAMVVAVSALFLVVPLRLVVHGIRELLSMAAPPEIRAQLQASVDAVASRFGVDESVVRAAKVCSRLDVEVGFVVGQDSTVRTVADCDQVREALHERLAALGHETSVSVAFTTDRKWVT